VLTLPKLTGNRWYKLQGHKNNLNARSWLRWSSVTPVAKHGLASWLSVVSL